MQIPEAGILRIGADVGRKVYHKAVPVMRYRGSYAEAPDWWGSEPPGIGSGRMGDEAPSSPPGPGLALLCPVRARARFINSAGRTIKASATVIYLAPGRIINSTLGVWLPRDVGVEMRPGETRDLVLAVGLGGHGYLIQNIAENSPPDTEVDASAGRYVFNGADLALGKRASVKVVIEHSFGAQSFYFRVGLGPENVPTVERVNKLTALSSRLLGREL